MRVSTAYFAGAGTVIAAIAVGLGGGLLIGDIMSPKTSGQGTEMTRLERHLSSQPIQAANRPPEPVPYLATPQPSASGTTLAAAPAQPGRPALRAAPPEADAAAAKPVEAAPPQPQAAQPVAREQAAAPEDATAKARDNEVKRVEDRRKAERRQQWAERRRRPQRPEQELRAVEERVRQDSEQTPGFRA